RGGEGRQQRGSGLVRLRKGGRAVSRIDEALHKVDVTLRVEVDRESFTQAVDLGLERLQQRRGRTVVVRRQRLRALAQPIQQDLAVADRAEARGDPAQLGAQRLRPL